MYKIRISFIIIHNLLILLNLLISNKTMGFASTFFSLSYKTFSILAFLTILGIIVSHILARFKRSPPLKLTSDSVVVIVGGCMGIGKLMAINIAKQFHCTIVIVDRKKQLFEEVSKQIKKHNGISQCFMCDLSDLKSIDKLIENIKKQAGKIDFLLYNAGILIPALSWQTSEQILHSVMNVNFFAPIKVINGLLSSLEGGHIAVVGSVASIIDGVIQISSYVSSKHAIYGYCNTLRQQLKKSKKNITVSIGCPYAINTTLFTGYKTKFLNILPILDEKYVAERLVREFINKKQVCFIGRRHALVVKITQFLPTFMIDWISINMDVSDYSELKKRK